MQVACPSCGKTLEYTGDRPRFCSYCGGAVSTSVTTPLAPSASEERTVPPSKDWSPDTAATVATAPSPNGDLGRGVPSDVGGYRLLRRLGGGGMGAVYEAEEVASGRRVALKLILPELGGSGDALVRFRQEGRLASSVAHPRCVFVLAADEEAGRPYIVMELMPGATLSDLVNERGPLPPEEAVAKILDVIDGLEEAHRLGVVHRDVKPSNCFLEANGRVKIGDFGLARSLAGDIQLTRTGAFIGTPLYAAPEQIHKKEPTDAQSDVYSVAATLYFLLTGRAPFQDSGDDAMAVMARIVTDDPPPLRSVRPKLPRALDRVVRRGLERDRRRRYRDLGELRRALLIFLPARPSVGGLGLRFGAELIDVLVRIALGSLVGATVVPAGVLLGLLPELPLDRAMIFYNHPIGFLVCIAYYGVFEGVWGCALGKGLLRLRVGTTESARPPGVWRAVLRAAIFYLMFQIATLLNHLLALVIDFPAPGVPPNPDQALIAMGAGLLVFVVFALSMLLNFGTMRARNGYRALHEFLSGTRTYRLHWPAPRPRRVMQSRAFHLDVTRPDGLPERVGPFRVRGALRWTDAERTLLAEDPQLGRSIWVWMRPVCEPPLDAATRDIGRATRARWVAAGIAGAWQWDAYIAPAGVPLPVLAAGTPRLSWAEVRPMLEELAEELEASCADETLPSSLSVDQVWVHPDGRPQLADPPLGALPDPADGNAASGEERALRLLGEVAVTALEGASRPIDEAGDRVRAPLPPHASQILDRLLGGPRPFRTVEAFRQELESLRDQPAEVTRLRRAGHLALTALLMHVPVCGPAPAMVVWIAFFALWLIYNQPQDSDPGVFAIALYVGLCCAFWVVWAFAFRGGYLYWRGGIALRRADGRKASRLQCAWRALLIWGPVGALLCSAVAMTYFEPTWPWLYFSLWGMGAALLPLDVVLALLWPARPLHDRIAGTYPVPA
jgi:hypothetical protein